MGLSSSDPGSSNEVNTRSVNTVLHFPGGDPKWAGRRITEALWIGYHSWLRCCLLSIMRQMKLVNFKIQAIKCSLLKMTRLDNLNKNVLNISCVKFIFYYLPIASRDIFDATEKLV